MERVRRFWGIICLTLQDNRIRISLIILIGFIHGMIFVFLMPPWQHYDEPGHFEYTKLITLRGSIPPAGDYDLPLAKEIYSSLVRSKFFSPNQPILQPDQVTDAASYRVWVHQIGDPPLYYGTAALLLRLLTSQSIEFQLYTGRILSLLFFLITIWVSYLFTVELTVPGSHLRWMVPGVIALLPGFVDVMTSFSNDPAAVMVFSLFLFACIRMIRRGIQPIILISVLLLTIACLLTKRTLWTVFLILPFALIFSAFRKRREKIGWAIALGGAFFGILIFFDWNDAALWYRDTLQVPSTRMFSPSSAGSSYALQLFQSSPSDSPALYQIIPLSENKQLSGKVITLGSWIWASAGATVHSAGIKIIDKNRNPQLLPGPVVAVGTIPVFHASTFSIPEDAKRIYVMLAPSINFDNQNQNISVYYMAQVLVQGQRSVDTVPIFTNQQETEGKWGELFKNLVRNPNASQTWPRIKPSILTLTSRASPDLGQALNWTVDLLDLRGNQWYLIYTLRAMFRTFWGKFGWGNVPLLGRFTYRSLELITLIVSAGLGIGLRINWKSIPWSVIFFCMVCSVFTFGMALYTGIAMGSLIDRDFIPVARFMFPLIIPIAFCISAGFISPFKIVASKTKQNIGWLTGLLFFSLFLWLDIIAYISITRFYNL